MSPESIIARELLLDQRQSIAGYEFFAQDGQQAWSDDADIEAVAACAAASLQDGDGRWLLGEQLVFLQATPAMLAADPPIGLRPPNTFLSLSMAELAEPATLAGARRWRERGFGISLRDVGSLIQPDVLAAMLAERRPVLQPVTALELDAATPDLTRQAVLLKQAGAMRLRLVARHAQNWEQAQACLAAALPVFAGRVYLSAPPSGKKTALSPAQSTILQLMEMVRQEADIRSLETLLKRDAALSFKLLRYI